jgi:hypothetical protein
VPFPTSDAWATGDRRARLSAWRCSGRAGHRGRHGRGVKYYQGGADEEPCLTTLGDDLGLTVTRGFDDVTGIGTPADSFVTAFRQP